MIRSSIPGWCSVVFAVVMASATWAEAPPASGDKAAKAEKYRVYIGTYTGPNSKGIYRVELDPATGKLTTPVLAGESTNPSFLAIDPKHRFLYAANEIDTFGGKKSGAVSAFAIDPKSGGLTLLNQQPSGGPGPCHVVVDKAGKNVLAANYGGGSFSVLPIQADGKLGLATAFVQHQGSSIRKDRQAGPHGHCVTLDSANHFAFVTDLGLDKIMIYKFDPAKGSLTVNDPPSVALTPGSGPRHFAFHPDGKRAYSINELNSTMTAMNYEAETGALQTFQSLSTLPKDFKGGNSCAEIAVHPSGKFLYGSNRGNDSIAIFAIDAKTGELSAAGHQNKKIKIPRSFTIDPTGSWLLVANQGSNSIVVFRIDPKTGELAPTENMVEVGAPVCVVVMPQ